MSLGPIALFWFRRDLRLYDNHGLYRALLSGMPVLPVFVFDRNILERLEDKDDRRVSFIHDHVLQLHSALREAGSTLLVWHGEPQDMFLQLIERFPVKAVFANHDHEYYSRERDRVISETLRSRGITFHTYKDQSIYERGEVGKEDGTPYTVFTPYMRKWRARFEEEGVTNYPSETELGRLCPSDESHLPHLNELGFKKAEYSVGSMEPSAALLGDYAEERDRPASVNGTSGIGVHLRFGTVSVRRMVQLARKHSEVWLNELIWREFFMQILWHFPHVVTSAFRPTYDRINWRNDEREFADWCEGRTGFPLVDAGMRQLRATGTMHNRVRMVAASFLTKHLLIDWRWGEAWFARWLMDFELSSNNGNWQWAAGCGCDAAPYFRVFNPQTQLKRFDPQMEYVLRWAPEYAGLDHPPPMVDHAVARQRALDAYAAALRS